MAGKGPGGKESDKQTDDGLSGAARAYSELFQGAPPRKTIPCLWCGVETLDVGVHIEEAHPKRTLADYVKDFKTARLLPDQAEPKAPTTPTPPEQTITVTSKEAKRHPGGRDAALLEKQLDPRDRKAYRDDVDALIAKGYPPSYTVASVAYNMTLARRYRMAAEEVRSRQRDVKGQVVVDTSIQDQLQKVEVKIQDSLKVLEAARATAAEEARKLAAADPLALINDTLLDAERWVRENIGELVDSCPGCGQMLSPPALPHWAFQPLQTESGREWPVWSTEGFELVRRREMRLSQLCLMLRTSPEGLKMTAERRGETWPDFIILEQEERDLRRYLNAADETALLGPTDRPDADPEGVGGV